MGYVVLAQAVRIENKQIKAIKNLPKPTLVGDIHMFIDFTNFNLCFIQGSSRIAASLTLLLKATELLDLALKIFRTKDNEVVGVDGRANRMVVNSSKNKKFRNLTHIPNIEATEKRIFLTPNTQKAFNHLRLAFDKPPIL